MFIFYIQIIFGFGGLAMTAASLTKGQILDAILWGIIALYNIIMVIRNILNNRDR